MHFWAVSIKKKIVKDHLHISSDGVGQGGNERWQSRSEPDLSMELHAIVSRCSDSVSSVKKEAGKFIGCLLGLFSSAMGSGDSLELLCGGGRKHQVGGGGAKSPQDK